MEIKSVFMLECDTFAGYFHTIMTFTKRTLQFFFHFFPFSKVWRKTKKRNDKIMLIFVHQTIFPVVKKYFKWRHIYCASLNLKYKTGKLAIRIQYTTFICIVLLLAKLLLIIIMLCVHGFIPQKLNETEIASKFSQSE